MTEYEITTAWIKVPSSDIVLDAYLAEPTAPGPFPGIIVIQEIFGVNAHIRDVTERIAKLGYIAIAPAIYQRQVPGHETGYTPADIQLGRQYKDQTQASQLLADLQATLNTLKTKPNLKPRKFGCIGFCFGGHVAYLAATLPEIQATASFYGAGIATFTPGGGPATLTRTKEIQGTLYAFFGTEDVSIPLAQVDAIEAELNQNQIPHGVFRYPNADHGFFCDQRASYNEAAASDAWMQVQQLFSRELQAASA